MSVSYHRTVGFISTLLRSEGKANQPNLLLSQARWRGSPDGRFRCPFNDFRRLFAGLSLPLGHLIKREVSEKL
jgi:hypothetical protein